MLLQHHIRRIFRGLLKWWGMAVLSVIDTMLIPPICKPFIEAWRNAEKLEVRHRMWFTIWIRLGVLPVISCIRSWDTFVRLTNLPCPIPLTTMRAFFTPSRTALWKGKREWHARTQNCFVIVCHALLVFSSNFEEQRNTLTLPRTNPVACAATVVDRLAPLNPSEPYTIPNERNEARSSNCCRRSGSGQWLDNDSGVVHPKPATCHSLPNKINEPWHQTPAFVHTTHIVQANRLPTCQKP